MRKQKRAFDVIRDNTIRVILKPQGRERIVWAGLFTPANCKRVNALLTEQLNPKENDMTQEDREAVRAIRKYCMSCEKRGFFCPSGKKSYCNTCGFLEYIPEKRRALLVEKLTDKSISAP